jgi:hypothetical protein
VKPGLLILFVGVYVSEKKKKLDLFFRLVRRGNWICFFRLVRRGNWIFFLLTCFCVFYDILIGRCSPFQVLRDLVLVTDCYDINDFGLVLAYDSFLLV